MTIGLLRRAAKLARLVRNRTYRQGLKVGAAAAIEHEGALRTIKPATLIDVGANIGQFSLAARAQHPDLVIHAFEPLSPAADRFDRLFSGESGVTLHRVAAGNTAKETDIHISGRPDSSSLLPISARQNSIFPGTAQVSTARIKVMRIDDVLSSASLPEPIMVKLDVQGFELSALQGMPLLLQRTAHVYLEASFVELYEGQPLADEIISYLADQGFRLSGVYNAFTTSGGASIQIDMMFTR